MDPAKPWITLEQTHYEVELPDDQWFGEWRGSRWPSPEWALELDSGLESAWINDRIRAERLH